MNTTFSYEVIGHMMTSLKWDCENPPELRPAKLTVHQGIIQSINWLDVNSPKANGLLIVPGGMNAHNHLESHAVLSSARAKIAFGETACATDFHEAGNVGGVPAIKRLIEYYRGDPFTYAHGVPSSVPSDPRWELVGTDPFGPKHIHELFDFGCTHLAEVMNYPGAIAGFQPVLDILEVAISRGMKIDGHAVQLNKEQALAYFGRGISSNHECTSLEEARIQADLGVKIWMRNGSAATDKEQLWPLLETHPHCVGFCTDDLHPDALLEGKGIFHQLHDVVVNKKVRLTHAIQAWVNPRLHYGVGGLLEIGSPADYVTLRVDSVTEPTQLSIDGVFHRGEKIAEHGLAFYEGKENQIDLAQCSSTWRRTKPVSAEQLRVRPEGELMTVICAKQGSLIKTAKRVRPKVEDGYVVADIENDIAKAVGLNRYVQDAEPSVMFISGFGITKPMAMVTSVAHDRHSPIGIGTNDKMLAEALSMVCAAKGGLCLISENHKILLPLPVYGLMSDRDITWVAEQYKKLERIVSLELSNGSMSTPFMTASFMGLIVIPEYGIGDDGMYRMGPNGPERMPSIFC